MAFDNPWTAVETAIASIKDDEIAELLDTLLRGNCSLSVQDTWIIGVTGRAAQYIRELEDKVQELQDGRRPKKGKPQLRIVC